MSTLDRLLKRKQPEVKGDDFEVLLNNTVTCTKEADVFGYAVSSKTLSDAIELMRSVNGEEAKKAAAAYAMYLSATQFKDGPYRGDVLVALDQLSRTKMELDRSAGHTFPIVEVTSEILLAVQGYADEETIPCTEWPSIQELTSAVFNEAIKYSTVDEWKLTQYDENGLVIDTYIADT